MAGDYVMAMQDPGTIRTSSRTLVKAGNGHWGIIRIIIYNTFNIRVRSSTGMNVIFS